MDDSDSVGLWQFPTHKQTWLLSHLHAWKVVNDSCINLLDVNETVTDNLVAQQGENSNSFVSFRGLLWDHQWFCDEFGFLKSQMHALFCMCEAKKDTQLSFMRKPFSFCVWFWLFNFCCAANVWKCVGWHHQMQKSFVEKSKTKNCCKRWWFDNDVDFFLLENWHISSPNPKEQQSASHLWKNCFWKLDISWSTLTLAATPSVATAIISLLFFPRKRLDQNFLGVIPSWPEASANRPFKIRPVVCWMTKWQAHWKPWHNNHCVSFVFGHWEECMGG